MLQSINKNLDALRNQRDTGEPVYSVVGEGFDVDALSKEDKKEYDRLVQRVDNAKDRAYYKGGDPAKIDLQQARLDEFIGQHSDALVANQFVNKATDEELEQIAEEFINSGGTILDGVDLDLLDVLGITDAITNKLVEESAVNPSSDASKKPAITAESQVSSMGKATPEQYSKFLEAYIQYGDAVFDELNMTDEQLKIMGYTVSPEIEKAHQDYIKNQENVEITNKLIEEAKEENKREKQFQEDLKENRAQSIDKNLEQQELTDIVSTAEGKRIYQEQQMRKLLGLPVLKGDMTPQDVVKEAEYYESGRSYNELTQGDKMIIQQNTKNAENIAFNEQQKTTDDVEPSAPESEQM